MAAVQIQERRHLLTGLHSEMLANRLQLMMLFMAYSLVSLCVLLLVLQWQGLISTSIIMPVFVGGLLIALVGGLVLTAVVGGLFLRMDRTGSALDSVISITLLTLTAGCWLLWPITSGATFNNVMLSLGILLLVQTLLIVPRVTFSRAVRWIQAVLPVAALLAGVLSPLTVRDNREGATVFFHINRGIELPEPLQARFPIVVEWNADGINTIIANRDPSVGQVRTEIATPLAEAESHGAYWLEVGFMDDTSRVYELAVSPSDSLTWVLFLVVLLCLGGLIVYLPEWQWAAPPLVMLAAYPFLAYLQINVWHILLSLLLTTGPVLVLLRTQVRRFHPVVGIGAALAIILLFGVNIAFPYDRLHHNYFLGPVNDVMNGKTMFVEGSAQYGLMISYIFGWVFSVTGIPLSYHGFSFVVSILIAIQFGLFFYLFVQRRGAYWMGLGMLFVMTLMYVVRSTFSAYSHPSSGPVRYGLILLYLAVALPARTPRAKRISYGLQLLVIYVAAMWSIETLVGTLAMSFGMLIYSELAVSRSWRQSLVRVISHGIAVLATIIVGIATFALFTWLRSGQLPIWDLYFGFVFTYADAVDWWLPIKSGRWWAWFFPYLILYGSLACLLYVLVFGPREKLLQHYAVTGVTLFGLLQQVYWIRVPLIVSMATYTLPLVYIVFYWVDELLNTDFPLQLRRSTQIAVIFGVFTAGVAAFTVEPVLPDVNTVGLELAHAAAERRGPDFNFDALTDPPVSYIRTTEPTNTDPLLNDTVTLLEEHFADVTRVAVFVKPDTATDALIRTRHTYVYPTSHPDMENEYNDVGKAWVLASGQPLRAGDQIILDIEARGVNDIQLEMLGRVRDTFNMQLVTMTDSGLAVLRLLEKS